MAIKEGITIITGGGFHGKSTLLKVIAAGVYPHIPGDGRERIVTRKDAVTVKSEEGRSVRQVNINSFIKDLPGGTKTTCFSTDNASGSTSQASGIVESLEAGSRLLLFDEDSCATNFLVRDDLIQKIVPPDREPIKPLYDAARSLWEIYGVSSIMVIGGLGIFLKKADRVLHIDEYRCYDITKKVRSVVGFDRDTKEYYYNNSNHRKIDPNNFNPLYINERLNKSQPVRIKPLRKDPKKLEYGMDLIDITNIDQLKEAPQTLAIGLMIFEMHKMLHREIRGVSLVELVDILMEKVERQGLDILDNQYRGTISQPRKYELIAAINRMRSLKIIE